MEREKLFQLRQSVEAQLSWVLRHNGDEELLDLLRVESEQLSMRLGQNLPHGREPLTAGKSCCG
jgi:hypothetical protein